MEREVKLSVDDYERVRRALEGIGRPLGSEDQLDVYLGSACLPGGSALRVRSSSSGGAWITYKGPLLEDEVKKREEVEVGVSGFDEALRLLLLAGFRELIRVRKRRETFEVEGLRVELDSVEGLGAFVEMEVRGDAELSRARGIAESLGLSWSPIKEGYAELLARKLGANMD